MKKSFAIMLTSVSLMMILGGCAATSRYYKMDAKEFREIDYGYAIEYVQVRNISIGYIDQGSGDKVLLLIHGLGSNAKGWIRNIPAWSEKHRVIAVDLPGYGMSDKDYYPYSLKFYARVLTEMMDELGIEKATFVGHSMGSQIAMITALDYPGRVDRLVLISPAGFEKFTDGEADWFRSVATPELARDASIRQIDINLKSNFYKMPHEAEFMVTDRIQVRGASDFEMYAYAVARNIHAMVNEPTSDRLKDINQPVLILFGEHDGLIPNSYLHGGKAESVAEIGQRVIPNNRLVIVPSCGHFVQFEKPEATNREVLDFMSDN